MGGEPARKVRRLIEALEERGWSYSSSNAHAHPAGILSCGHVGIDACRTSIYSTPRGGEDGQKLAIRRFVKRCRHGYKVVDL